MSEPATGILVTFRARLIAVECHPGEEGPCALHLPPAWREARILPVRAVPPGYMALNFQGSTLSDYASAWREFWRFQDVRAHYED